MSSVAMIAKSKPLILITILGIVAIFVGACTQQQPTFTITTPVVYSVPELKYRLFSYFDDVFYVDPHLYPVPRETQEEKSALEEFPLIIANEDEFSAILKYLGMSNKADYSNEEELLVYRQH